MWRRYGRKQKKMRGIGIANIVDEVNGRENSGIERINRMPYPQRGEHETLISMGENHFEDGACYDWSFWLADR